GVMNSLPPEHRGAGSGMNTTFQNSAQVLSIGIFFSLMIVGLSSSLPANLFHGLVANGVSPTVASRASHLPPVSTLFAAFLGVNPVQHLIGPQVLSHLTAAQQATVTGRSFFPGLITAPFRAGLHAAFDFAIVASLLAAAASWTRGAHVRPAPTAGDPHAMATGSENGSWTGDRSRRESANAGLPSSQPAIES
ncbi:MAG: MFS transporter, partial [Acidimicrobiales bacterium]